MRTQLMGVAAVLALVGGITMAVTENNTPPKAASITSFPTNLRVGVWNWTQPDLTTDIQDSDAAVALKAQGVTEVYIDISSYNDYDELPSPDRQAKVDGFNHALAAEVAALREQGISAHALVGNKHWSDPDVAYIPLKLLNYVHSYNASVPSSEQLNGIQFDIEFYNDKEFKDDRAQNTTNYLALVRQLVTLRTQLFGDSDFALGFAVPSVLNGQATTTVPNVPFDGVAAQPPLTHIVSMLKDVPASYVALMVYRNHATGDGGTIDVAAPSVKIIQDTGAGKVAVLIGEETTKQTPVTITYFGGTKATLHAAVTQIRQAYQHTPAFDGIAINDQQGFLDLKD